MHYIISVINADEIAKELDSKDMFWTVYKDLVDEWITYDNKK